MQIFELFGSILLKDQGVEGKLDKIDKKGKSVSKGMGLSFGSIAGAALKLGAVLGVGLGIKDMITTAAAGEEKLAQMDAVLKSTGGAAGMTKDELIKLAEAQGKLTTFSKGANMESENLLLTFTGIGKKVFPDALKSVNDMSTALGQDTKSSCIQLGKALNDPLKGITALSRVGVSFTKQQKDQIAALVKSGKTMEAQKIILAELAKEFGGSAEAAGKTFNGQLTILKNGLTSMGGAIGKTVLPYLTQFVTWVNQHMPQIQAAITTAMTFIVKAFNEVADFVKVNVIPTLQKLYNWIKPNIPAIKDIVKGAFDIICKVLKVVGDFITTSVVPTFNKMKDWFVANFPAIKDAVMKAYNYIKPSFDKLVNTVKTDLMPIIMGLWDTVKKAMPGIQAIFEIVFPIVVKLVKNIIDDISTFIEVVKGIYDFIKPGLDLVADIFSRVFGGIRDIIKGVQKVLDIFNGTPMKDKNSTVTTNYKTTGKEASGVFDTSGLEKKALGDNNWRGGPVITQEAGGEILDLPSGTRIIPHDVSMEMAKNSVKNNNNNTSKQPITIQLVLQNGKAIAEFIIDDLDNLMGKKSKIYGRRVGIV